MSLPPSQQPWLFPLSLIGWRWAPKPRYRLKLRRRKKFSLKRACNSNALSHAAVGADPRHRPTLEGRVAAHQQVIRKNAHVGERRRAGGVRGTSRMISYGTSLNTRPTATSTPGSKGLAIRG